MSNGKKGKIDILSLDAPDNPKLIKSINLVTGENETVNSVAVHPYADYFIAVIETAGAFEKGRAEIRSTKDGSLIKQFQTGVGPDAVVINSQGTVAIIPNEAEEFIYDKNKLTFDSAAGSVSLIRLSNNIETASIIEIELSDLTDVPGVVEKSHGRKLERGIDFNEDGKIIEEGFDLNANGTIEDEKTVIGKLYGKEVKHKETDGEMVKLPLIDNRPAYLEPEYAVFSPDGKIAWVTLQENNAIAVIDVEQGRVKEYFGLGMTKHHMDIDDDDSVNITNNKTALREPDGIGITPDGKYLITADEGDTDPKASKVKGSLPVGGGRSITMYDASTGKVLSDTGAQIDIQAHLEKIYPESRSDNKGSEPEMVVAFEIKGQNYAAASLERANAVALINLADPAQPRVISIAAIDPEAEAGKMGPEGIAHYEDETGQHYVYTANEKNGTVSVFRILP